MSSSAAASAFQSWDSSAAGSASWRLSRMVPSKTCVSWATWVTCSASVSGSMLAALDAGEMSVDAGGRLPADGSQEG
jgi:hypothetical protein